jgi:hypothetical protein
MPPVAQPSPRHLDRFLLLYQQASLKRRGQIWGDLQMHKIAFLAESDAVLDRKLATPSFEFIRYTMGPWSKELAQEATALQSIGLLSAGRHPSNRALQLVDRWKPALEPWLRPALEATDAVVASKGTWNGTRLKEHVYTLPASRYGLPYQTVADVQQRDVFLAPKDTPELQRPDLPDEVLLKLAIDLSTTAEELEAARQFDDDLDAQALALLRR